MLSKEYLLERGYCCGHGCLMCPYEPKHIEGNTTMSKNVSNELKIAVLEKKVADLQKQLNEFMSKWGPEVQEKRDERDKRGIVTGKQTKMAEAITKIENMKVYTTEQTMDATIKRANAETSTAIDQAVIALNEAEISKKTRETRIERIETEAAGALLYNVLMKAQTANVKADTANKAKQKLRT